MSNGCKKWMIIKQIKTCEICCSAPLFIAKFHCNDGDYMCEDCEKEFEYKFFCPKRCYSVNKRLNNPEDIEDYIDD